jgi:putative acetyltransferase
MSLALDIRSERPGDRAAIRTLLAAAFGPDDDTEEFVEAVRVQASVCLAEVAVAAGRIVGHAQWCDAPLVIDGRRVRAAYLTCLSAEPVLQRRGVGSQLVRSGLWRLSERGYAAATLLGDPAYYGRFGFSPELATRIEAPHRLRGPRLPGGRAHPGRAGRRVDRRRLPVGNRASRCAAVGDERIARRVPR